LRGALERGRARLGGSLARVPQADPDRAVVGRAAVGAAAGGLGSGRHRSRPRVRDRVARDDAPLPRASARPRRGVEEFARRRLRSPLVVTAGYLVSERPSLPAYDLASRRELEGWAADLHARRTS